MLQTPLQTSSRLFFRQLTCDFFRSNYPENTAFVLETEPGSQFASRRALRFRTTDPLATQTSALHWVGRVYADGRYQLVTQLGGLLANPSATDTNNQRQIAVVGRL